MTSILLEVCGMLAGEAGMLHTLPAAGQLLLIRLEIGGGGLRSNINCQR